MRWEETCKLTLHVWGRRAAVEQRGIKGCQESKNIQLCKISQKQRMTMKTFGVVYVRSVRGSRQRSRSTKAGHDGTTVSDTMVEYGHGESR